MRNDIAGLSAGFGMNRQDIVFSCCIYEVSMKYGRRKVEGEW